MSEDQERGFVIRDKRGAADPAPAPSSAPFVEAPPADAPRASAANPQEHEEAIPLTFSSFILSLGTSTLMLLGEQFSPDQPAAPVNLPQAKEIIEILSMLETKTQGNLSSDEATVLLDMLYTLRMKYVERASGTNK
ncbi:MAG: DUF1844 domain-containing protein [Nitrospirota bacterium]|nr:DUF1844 domain-containing protein [Nitrospirota bacterium]